MFFKIPTFSLVLVLLFSICNAENYLRLNDEGNINAQLKNVPLSEIKNILQDTFEIEFNGDEQIYQTELTMSFDGLQMDRALNRLFDKFNFVVEYNSQGKATQISIFSPAGGFSNLPRRFGSNQVLSNNFKEIYAKKIAALQTLDHYGGKSRNLAEADEAQMMIPEKEDKKIDLAAFKVKPNTPPGNPAVIDPNSLPINDDTFKVIRNTNPSGKDFQIVPSAPPSRKK